MTRPGQSPLGPHVLKKIARLMQLHHSTHPDRVGRQFGVTSTYVRQVWAKYLLTEMAPLHEALEALNATSSERREDSAANQTPMAG